MDRLATVVLTSLNRLSKIVRSTRYIISLLVTLIFLFNIVVLFNNAEPVPKNSIESLSRTYTCYEPKDFFFIWDIVHIVLYSILPFSIILAENAFLMYLALTHANRIRRMKNLTMKSSFYPNATIRANQQVYDDALCVVEEPKLKAKSRLITR